MNFSQVSSVTPGQILYLQPKRDKAEAGNDFHIVTEGETMYSDFPDLWDKTEKSSQYEQDDRGAGTGSRTKDMASFY